MAIPLPPVAGPSAAREPSPSYRWASLRTLLTWPLLLLTIGPVALVGYLSFRNGQRAVDDLAVQLQAEVSDRVEQHLDAYFMAPRQINRLNQSALQNGLLNLDQPTLLGRYFWQQMQVFPDVSYINYTDTAGQFVGVGRETNGDLYLEVNDPSTPRQFVAYRLDQDGNLQEQLRQGATSSLETPRFAETKAVGKPTWTSLYAPPRSALGEFSISCGIPIYAGENTLAGVAGVDLFLPQVTQFLQGLAFTQTTPDASAASGEVMVIKRDGSVVASSSHEALSTTLAQPPNLLNTTDPLSQAIAEQILTRWGSFETVASEQRFAFHHDNQRQFVQITPWQDPWGLDLLLLVSLPESSFMGQINANTRQTLLLCLATLAAAIGLGLWAARWLSRPLTQLSQASQELAQAAQTNFTNLTSPPVLKAQSVQELDTLVNAFNSMTAQLQQSFEELAAQNISLQHTQLALASAKEQLEAVLNAVPGPISWVDAGGVYIGVNRHFAESWQLSQEAFVGREVGFLQGSRELAEFTHQFLDSPAQSASQIIALQLSDQWRYYLIAAQKYQQGQAAVSVGIDVTEQEMAKEALRIAEENYRSIFENALEGLFQSSPDGQFINANPALAKIYGYSSPAELLETVTHIGNQLYVQPEEYLNFQAWLNREGRVRGVEHQCYGKDGRTIWIQLDARAVRDSNDRVLYYEGIVQDITERKRQEADLRKQLEDLKIEIDQKKREEEVAQLTQSTYFQEVQQEIARVNLDEFWN